MRLVFPSFSVATMSIQPGETLPDTEIYLAGETIERTRTADLFADRRVLLFAVPGAFTPTCSNKHLPGYIEHMPVFRERGIEVMCLAVNDAYVMQAWGRNQHIPGDLLMLADGNGQFTRSMGLELDGSAYGMGLRARRFALFAENGVVRLLQVEAPGELKVSTAAAMLDAI
jgi:peroxiredoxin